MAACKSVYQPQEDSSMLERYVRLYAKGIVLDIGTGSGIQSITAAQNPEVKSVLATDVQEGVIDYCYKNIKNRKIKFLQSDMFRGIKGKFDTVIFNPPYLPQELKLRDLTIEGGKKGYEVIERFLDEVNNFLKPDGIILMVFSTFTKKEKVEEFIRNNMLDFEMLEKAHIFFEDIYVYLLRKSGLLRTLEKKGIINIKYMAKGHRGLLFIGKFHGKKVAVKTENPKSSAIGRIENEAKWLKKLNRHGIGPELLIAEKSYFVYKFIFGDGIIDYMKKSNKIKIKKIIKKIFEQMFVLDKMKIDKEEMHHPVKHIIVSDGKPHLIDFERTHHVLNPKNVTQFCQFLMSGSLDKILKSKKILIKRKKVMELAKIYKNNQSRANLNKIINLL